MGSGDYCDVVHSTATTYCHGSLVRRSRYVALDVMLDALRHAKQAGIGIGLGGLIGYGIGQIKADLPAWRYEFIIIGYVCNPSSPLTLRVACAVWAIVMGIIIPDSPYSTTYFTRHDRVLIQSRKRDDYQGVEKRQLRWGQVKESVLDVKTYLYFFLGLSANIPNGGTSNFGTLMTQGFGFNTLQTTLLQSKPVPEVFLRLC